MSVDDFGVSEKCLSELKGVGFSTVEDVAIFLEKQANIELL